MLGTDPLHGRSSEAFGGSLSIDEAKAGDVRLDEALQEIADGIEGGAARAHVVLSGRHTDWEFRRDLERLETSIAMPPADIAAPAIDPNELIISVLRRENPPERLPPAEAPLVVVIGARRPDSGGSFRAW
jgi:hypothetical protein